jgi:lipid-A-disaccharide synthase-like uncharacterized protein
MDVAKVWLAVGLLGQACFFLRFLIQWIASERRGESVVPIYFWYFSIAGGLILLAYAVFRLDPVFILGQSVGLLVYVRNLWLIARRRRVTLEGRTLEPGPGEMAHDRAPQARGG